ncbi:hypothetical protein NFI96_019129 [Prochilodus magdalenae]|nr:hypothetical protein NFI96_019129 [Prochilodus magdalenae]
MVEEEEKVKDWQLQTQLETYMSDTLTFIKTVKEFCDQEPRWTLQRELEIKKMKEIKNKVEQFFGGCKKKNQERELGETLKDTLEGLEKLQHFLDAVERLAVTSPLVFKDEVFLPRGMSAKDVRSVISTARMVSSLLIHFKRDDGAFFFPSLDNLDVLVFQLHKYMRVVQWLCKKMNFRELIFLIYFMWKNRKPLQFSMEKRESMINVIVHLGQLSNIRMDKSFGLTYLFDEGAQDFIDKYTECCSEMFQFLLDLEETAVKLDKVKTGSSISTVAGSSVGAVGGILSIVGLALAPITAGVSLTLTLTGVGLGVTSGVNGLVTGVTESRVKKRQREKGEYIFRNFMGDVQKVLDSLEQRQYPGINLEGGDEACGGKADVQEADKNIKDLRDEMALVALKGEALVRSAARGIGSPLAITKAAGFAGMAVNALFIGFNIAFICKESLSLAKREKSEVSQLFRSRSALWRSEIVGKDV